MHACMHARAGRRRRTRAPRGPTPATWSASSRPAAARRRAAAAAAAAAATWARRRRRRRSSTAGTAARAAPAGAGARRRPRPGVACGGAPRACPPAAPAARSTPRAARAAAGARRRAITHAAPPGEAGPCGASRGIFLRRVPPTPFVASLGRVRRRRRTVWKSARQRRLPRTAPAGCSTWCAVAGQRPPAAGACDPSRAAAPPDRPSE